MVKTMSPEMTGVSYIGAEQRIPIEISVDPLRTDNIR